MPLSAGFPDSYDSRLSCEPPFVVYVLSIRDSRPRDPGASPGDGISWECVAAVRFGIRTVAWCYR